MKMNKKLLSLVVAGSVLFGVTTGVFAAEAARQITATLDPTVNVTYNGTLQNLKDANGDAVYPIVYNGSTYLPVRAVSDVLGVKVDWDGPTNTVILTDPVSGGNADNGGATDTDTPDTPDTPEPGDSGAVDLANAMGAGNNRVFRITDKDSLTEDGRTFSSGIERVIWNGASSTSKSNVVTIDVKGKDTLTVTGWADVDAVLSIMDKDANVYESFSVSAGTFVEKTIDISNYDEIAFGANAQKSGVKGTAKFFDPIAK